MRTVLKRCDISIADFSFGKLRKALKYLVLGTGI
jgi:hypothetical protein